MNYYEYQDYLAHYGVKGQKWGVRRYQNADGTLTSLGKKREQKHAFKELKKYDSKGVDRDQAVWSKSYKLANGVREGRKYVNDILNSWDRTSKIHEIKANKVYLNSLRDHLNKTGKEADSDTRYELYKDARKKTENDKDVVASRKETKHLESTYNQKVQDLADSILGKYGDVVIRKQSTKNTAKDALNDTIWSAAVTERNKNAKNYSSPKDEYGSLKPIPKEKADKVWKDTLKKYEKKFAEADKKGDLAWDAVDAECLSEYERKLMRSGYDPGMEY